MSAITIDVANKSETELAKLFRDAYNTFPTPLQVWPRTPAVVEVVNADIGEWRKYALSAGFRWAVCEGTTVFAFSLEPLGASYYRL